MKWLQLKTANNVDMITITKDDITRWELTYRPFGKYKIPIFLNKKFVLTGLLISSIFSNCDFIKILKNKNFVLPEFDLVCDNEITMKLQNILSSFNFIDGDDCYLDFYTTLTTYQLCDSYQKGCPVIVPAFCLEFQQGDKKEWVEIKKETYISPHLELYHEAYGSSKHTFFMNKEIKLKVNQDENYNKIPVKITEMFNENLFKKSAYYLINDNCSNNSQNFTMNKDLLFDELDISKEIDILIFSLISF